MAKRKLPARTELTTTGAEHMPAFMQNVDHGVEELSQFVVPPRFKMVQKQSGAPFDNYAPGTALVLPAQVELAGPSEAFHFVPLFFFAEWCLWNPIQLKDQLPMIRERTLDKTSPMVALARDPERWSITCPENEKFECRYVEHLNFVVMPVYHHAIDGVPFNITFSKSEHRTGANLASLVRMRRAPIFGCVMEARSARRANAMGDWWGLDVSQPSAESGVEPWVTEQQMFELYQEMHLELKAQHESRVLRPDYDDTVTETIDAEC